MLLQNFWGVKQRALWYVMVFSGEVNCRPVRQRPVRSETTKDKAGALLPAVYANDNSKAVTKN